MSRETVLFTAQPNKVIGYVHLIHFSYQRAIKAPYNTESLRLDEKTLLESFERLQSLSVRLASDFLVFIEQRGNSEAARSRSSACLRRIDGSEPLGMLLGDRAN